jgi:hypothetical protein
MKADLKRGGSIKVSENYPRKDLQGKTLTIASKGTTICNGKGRCASEDHCVGFSVFVTDPKVPAAKKGDKKIGWRHGTVKICLTYLEDESGKPLIPLDKPLPARTKRTPKEPTTTPRFEVSPPTNGHSSILVGVTWQALAEAHQAKDVDLLATYCRTLKSEHEKMALRLVNAQAKLLERQEVPSELRGMPRVRSS